TKDIGYRPLWKPNRVRAPGGQLLPAAEAQCCDPGICHAPVLKESVVSLGSSSRSRSGLSRRDSFKLRLIRPVRHHRVGLEGERIHTNHSPHCDFRFWSISDMTAVSTLVRFQGKS